MTDQMPPNQGDQHEAGTARPASVQLRQQGAQMDHASLMDPANQSLAEALRITFRILQIAMVVLAGLYVLSGFQSIKTNERGVRLLFGEVAAQDLRPGFHFSAPYPIGELVKVDVGNKQLEIDRMFWPYVEPGREQQPVSELRSTPGLSPEQDGSMLTGDGAIAHSQWRVQFSRADATQYARNVYPEHEVGLIRAAAMRGIVRAVAGVEIDELLKQGVSEEDSVALYAKRVALETLQEMAGGGTGLEIEQLALESKIPPAYLRDSFNSVLEATSRASTARENAQREGSTMLSNAAGGAAPLLVDLIDQYERQTDAGEDAAAVETMALIKLVFDGEPVTIDGREVHLPIGGDVAQLLAGAEEYRSSVVGRARSDLANLQAKLQQFQKNPTVMVVSDWSGALSSFFADERVEVFFNPPGTDTLEILINRDPEIAKDAERRRREAENEAARQDRERQMELDRYRIREGLTETPG